MSNPTRETIERWRAFHSGEDEQPGMPEIFDFALRALDLQERLEKAANTWDDAILRFAIKISIRQFNEDPALQAIVERFDGASEKFDGGER